MARYTFSLLQTPNQSFNTRLNGVSVNVILRTHNEITYASISIENVPAVFSVRCVSGQNILPREYEDALNGNFVFVDSKGFYPNFERFNGVDCILYFNAKE